MRRSRILHRARGGLLVLGLAPVLLGACSHSWSVENRETPVHVWLTAPELAAQGGMVDLEVRVGNRVAVDGPVQFPCGIQNVVLPTVHLPAGSHPVTVTVRGGTLFPPGGPPRVARGQTMACGETWVRVTMTRAGVSTSCSGEEPTAPQCGVLFNWFGL